MVSEEVTLSILFCLPAENGSALKESTLLPVYQFFSF